ncbi:MAG: DUF1990 domain-containing protein [Chloroflexota bacterium]|nr:DUF1990 domain-containing protein [Chloroflexota bacterium]
MNPLHLITRAHLSWFSNGHDDARYLERWRDVPLAYQRGQDVTGWTRHEYRIPLGNAGEERFQRAADALLRYQFYPRDVMRHTSDFGIAGRRMKMGDRIVQRIPVITLLGTAGADVMTMNEIVEVVDEPRCAGFTYITTQAHSEEGEWSVRVDWADDDALWLMMHAVSRPAPREPRLIHPLMRYMQKRSHRRGIEHFATLLQE